MSNTIKEFEQLLSNFEKVPDLPHRDPTFLEICEFPHREVICSNILCFFFNSNGEHKLKDLFVRSLLECIDMEHEYCYQNFHCEREVTTADDKRIDLLLTSNDIAIVIENKIYADLNNDLDAYLEHIKDYKNQYGVVLSLKDISKNNQKFEFITYKKFFERIKKNIGFYIEKADKKYLTFLLDFMENINNLREGYGMDKDFIEFLNQNGHGDATVNLINRVNEFNNYLSKKTKELKEEIDRVINNMKDKDLSSYLWNPEKEFDKIDLWKGGGVVYNFNDYKIDILVCIGYWGCSFQIYIWNKNEKNVTEKHEKKLKEFLKKPVSDGKIDEENSFRLNKSYSLENIDNNLGKIVNTLQKIVETICKPEFFK